VAPADGLPELFCKPTPAVERPDVDALPVAATIETAAGAPAGLAPPEAAAATFGCAAAAATAVAAACATSAGSELSGCGSLFVVVASTRISVAAFAGDVVV